MRVPRSRNNSFEVVTVPVGADWGGNGCCYHDFACCSLSLVLRNVWKQCCLKRMCLQTRTSIVVSLGNGTVLCLLLSLTTVTTSLGCYDLTGVGLFQSQPRQARQNSPKPSQIITKYISGLGPQSLPTRVPLLARDADPGLGDTFNRRTALR